MGVRVRFSDVDELIEELRLSREAVHGGIVRVTGMLRASAELPGTRTVSLVATALLDDGLLLRLEAPCGRLWGDGEDAASAETRGRLEALRERVLAACRELGLETRAGIYELPGEER